MRNKLLIVFFFLLNFQGFTQEDSLIKENVLSKYAQATLYIEKALPDLALPILFELDDSTKFDLPLNINVRISIADACRQQHDFSKGISIIKEILNTSVNIDSQTEARIYSRLAALYNEYYDMGEKRLDSVIKYSKKSMFISKENGFSNMLASSQNEVGFVYMNLKKHKIAEAYYLNAYHNFLKTRDSINLINVSINMSTNYKRMGLIYAADSVINNALKFSTEKENKNMFMRIYLQKSSIYESIGDYKKAFEFLHKGRIMQKQYFHERINAQIYEMSAKYKLKEQQNKIKNEQLLNLKKQKENRYLIILIIALLIILIISIVVFYLKRKTNIQNEKIIQYDKQLLETNLEYKNKELSTAIAHSVAYNDVLESVKKALSSKDKKDAINIINANIDTEKNWHNFLLNFNQIYPSFFSKLSQVHPRLTENETKLSALLMMGLKSKEIAAVFNIALSSVNKNRQRLRKKLQLEPEEDIALYFTKYM